ncbi:hypothetical protein RI367_002751 [Sorochytrium milnesiophthora]
MAYSVPQTGFDFRMPSVPTGQLMQGAPSVAGFGDTSFAEPSIFVDTLAQDTLMQLVPQALEQPLSETLVPTAEVYQHHSGLQDYVRRIVKHHLCRKYGARADVPIPGELGYISPTYDNMANRISMAKVINRIGFKAASPFDADLKWKPTKPDRRHLFGVPLTEQLETASLPYVVNTASGQQVPVRLPVLPAIFLACLLKRKSVYSKETLFRDNFGCTDDDDLFLINYVDSRSYDNVDRYGESHALKNADTVFKLWLRTLPDSVVPVEVSSAIKDGYMPFARDVERNMYPFGSELPPGVVFELRLLVQLLRDEEKALLFAIINACIPVAKERGIGPVFIARMLSPCLCGPMLTAVDRGIVLLTFLFIACDTYGDLFEAVPQWVISDAQDQQRLAAGRLGRRSRAHHTSGDDMSKADSGAVMPMNESDVPAIAEASAPRPKKITKFNFPKGPLASTNDGFAVPAPVGAAAHRDNSSISSSMSIASTIRKRLFAIGKKK